MISMPKKFSVNDIGINTSIFILESPIMVRPISSGRGEATTKAPKKGSSQRNNFSLKIDINLFWLVFLSSELISLARLSFIKRKINKSPTKAPSPPNRATSQIEFTCAISKSTTPAGAVVNMETKNMPAKKTPRNLHACVLVKILLKTPVWAKITATITLRTTAPRSRSKLLLASSFFIGLELKKEEANNNLLRDLGAELQS